jgi:hypothetical protein
MGSRSRGGSWQDYAAERIMEYVAQETAHGRAIEQERIAAIITEEWAD